MGTIYEKDLLYVVMLTQGLLSTTRYTERTHEDNSDEPEIRKFDNGKNWEKDGCNRRFESFAVNDAIALLREITRELLDQEELRNDTDI